MHGTSTVASNENLFPPFFPTVLQALVWTADISYRVRWEAWYIGDRLIGFHSVSSVILSMVNGRAGWSRIGTLCSLTLFGERQQTNLYHPKWTSVRYLKNMNILFREYFYISWIFWLFFNQNDWLFFRNRSV